MDENKLISILNSQWKKASFGYKIHEDVRIAESLAETLRTEVRKNLDDLVDDDDGGIVKM